MRRRGPPPSDLGSPSASEDHVTQPSAGCGARGKAHGACAVKAGRQGRPGGGRHLRAEHSLRPRLRGCPGQRPSMAPLCLSRAEPGLRPWPPRAARLVSLPLMSLTCHPAASCPRLGLRPFCHPEWPTCRSSCRDEDKRRLFQEAFSGPHPAPPPGRNAPGLSTETCTLW